MAPINQPSSRIGMRPDRVIAYECTGFKICQVKLACPRIDQRSGSIPAKPVRHSNLDRQLFDTRSASFLPHPAQATATHPRATGKFVGVRTILRPSVPNTKIDWYYTTRRTRRVDWMGFLPGLETASALLAV
jgi:hypothetical protein